MGFEMRTKGAVPTVAVVLAVVISAIVLRNRSSDLRIEHVKSLRAGEGVTIETFCVTNRTRSEYFLGSPVFVEVRNGSWKPCFKVEPASFTDPNLMPTSAVYCTFWATNLPIGVPLRLTLASQRRLTGALAGFSARYKSHVLDGQKALSLNPWDKNSQVLVYKKPSEIVGETLIER